MPGSAEAVQACTLQLAASVNPPAPLYYGGLAQHCKADAADDSVSLLPCGLELLTTVKRRDRAVESFHWL
ncbi:UNVERIFIED_CONTAM: hypothetical protein FKN15_041811 [Acipenser sinensis]